MRPRIVVALRGFVAASLVAGGLLLIEEARLLRERPFAWVVALVVNAGIGTRRRLPAATVAAPLLLSVLGAIGWAHFSPSGHLVLSGIAPAVAILAGVGFYRRDGWSWPVAFAISAGIGPLFLTFAPLPDVTYLGAFALFVALTLVLLVLRVENDDGTKG